MRRSLGVTLSAVALLVVSAVPLILGMLAVLSFFSPLSMPFPGVTIFRAVITVVSLTALGLASWAIASAVGLIALRRWARASMLVISSLMIYLSLPAVFLVPFWRIRYIAVAPLSFGEAGWIGVGPVYAALAVLGIFWLYFFNRQSVKAQFQAVAANEHRVTQPALSPSHQVWS